MSVQTDPHRQEYDKMGRTIAEMFIDQGREEGAIKGALEKGREILLRHLRKRFKRVPQSIRARIAATTDVHELDTWLDKVLDAESLDDVGIKHES